ncbi:hypothetical protein HID58_067092, partial [Brassica napus]
DKEEAPNSCSSYSQRRHINVKRLTSSKLDCVVDRERRSSSMIENDEAPPWCYRSGNS